MKLVHYVIVVPLALASCTEVVCGCTQPPMKEAVVWGRVTTNSGGAASRAAMSALATPTGVCVRDTMYAWGSADSLGRYRISVFGAGIVDSGCVFVGARFPVIGSNPRDTVRGPLRMRFLDSIPFDSMHVDIVLPP